MTLIGAGPVDPAALARAMALAPDLVAADGGGDTDLPDAAMLHAVIGDMDSLADAGALRRRGVALHQIAEQESTDLEKCLYSVAAPRYLGLGFLGGRVDHTLAAMNVLVRYPHRPVLLLGAQDLCFACPSDWSLDVPRGLRVSLFPMAPVTGGACSGLRWPVEGLAMAPAARTGTSNEALGGDLRLAFDAPGMIVILPAEMLEPVFATLEERHGYHS